MFGVQSKEVHETLVDGDRIAALNHQARSASIKFENFQYSPDFSERNEILT